MAKKDVAKVKDDGVPDYLGGFTPDDMPDDNFTGDDIVIPQIKLLQGTSEQIQLFDTARSGEFWHTGFDSPLGKEVRFIVCSRKRKYLLQAPMDDGQGVLARADDAITWDRVGSWEVQVDKKTKVTWAITDLNVVRSGLIDWGTFDPEADPQSPPAATLFYEYLVILPDFPDYGPAVISLARSAIKGAKKGINTKIDLHKAANRPQQSLVFEARSIAEVNDSGQDYSNWMFSGVGFASAEEYQAAKQISDTISVFVVKDEGDQTPNPARVSHPAEDEI